MTTAPKHTPAGASQTLMAIQVNYSQRGIPLSQAALCGAKNYVAWNHYPSNDCVDKSTGYEFYYHAHSPEEIPEAEHGHFHLFRRSLDQPTNFSHLIGIALDRKGLPVRLFTTNQWVTGETMADAEMVSGFIGGFVMHPTGRMAPITNWISAMLQLYAEEIKTLVHGRDERIAELSKQTCNDTNILEDRAHAVLTCCQIDLISKLSVQ